MLKKLIVCALVSSSALPVVAQVDMVELGVNGDRLSKNITVVPQALSIDMHRHSLSYDLETMTNKNELARARGVTSRLSLADQAKVSMFWHNALIEKQLIPSQIPKGSVPLDIVVSKSLYNTSMVKTIDDYHLFIRSAYTQKLNKIIRVVPDQKAGNVLILNASNYSDYPLTHLKGNLRIVDEKTGRIYFDQQVSQSIKIPKEYMETFKVDIPVNVEGWKDRVDGLSYKFTVQEVQYKNGFIFNADDFYKASNKLEVINDYPFTEITE